jgi:hypothetical protein
MKRTLNDNLFLAGQFLGRVEDDETPGDRRQKMVKAIQSLLNIGPTTPETLALDLAADFRREDQSAMEFLKEVRELLKAEGLSANGSMAPANVTKEIETAAAMSANAALMQKLANPMTPGQAQQAADQLVRRIPTGRSEQSVRLATTATDSRTDLEDLLRRALDLIESLPRDSRNRNHLSRATMDLARRRYDRIAPERLIQELRRFLAAAEAEAETLPFPQAQGDRSRPA